MDHVPPQYQHDASLTFLQTARHYLAITKPGIVFGNLITVMGGFFLASRGHVDIALFLATIVGVSLIVAAGCVFNNCIDQDIDRHMVRTQYRALPQGWITLRAALIYGSILGVCGAWLLYSVTNRLALALALLGFVIYVGIYSLYMKRRSVYSTAIGSLSGAMPPVIGYCAVSGRFDATALMLLAIFSLWQIPHFYAITLFRRADYKAAGIPLLPVATTKAHIVVTILIFAITSLMPALYGATGMAYLLVAAIVGIWWLALALVDYRAANVAAWARRLFFFSIIAVVALSFMMAVDF